MQFIIITKTRVIRCNGRSHAHVTQAVHDVGIRALSIIELKEEEEA